MIDEDANLDVKRKLFKSPVVLGYPPRKHLILTFGGAAEGFSTEKVTVELESVTTFAPPSVPS